MCIPKMQWQIKEDPSPHMTKMIKNIKVFLKDIDVPATSKPVYDGHLLN